MASPADPFFSSDSWLGNIGLMASLFILFVFGLAVFAKGVFDLIRDFRRALRNRSNDESGRHAAD